MTEKSNGTKYQPSCMLAHGLLNRLAVIVGYCDLMAEGPQEDSECSQRLTRIRDAAKAAAEELREHQCTLDAVTRIASAQRTQAHKS